MARSPAPHSLRLPQRLARVIAREARQTGRTFSAVATEMLEEAARTRTFRHIVFTGPPGGRRASLSGVGMDVWEVVRDFRGAGGSMKRLAKALKWVPEEKLKEALAYAAVYPEEIEERLERESEWSPQAVREAMPWSVPPLKGVT
ncbi:MAG TPA: hypothetical protein VD793_01485 [Gemmatimonadales bacterium]|nr:hypothetical protein [Gemmatimonadales bacterium]